MSCLGNPWCSEWTCCDTDPSSAAKRERSFRSWRHIFNTRTDQLVILNVFEGAYPRQKISIEPGESGAERCFCGAWSSYTELIGTLLQSASLLQGTGHCCLAGFLISCRGQVSVAACLFAAPWIAKAARYPSTSLPARLSRNYVMSNGY